MLVVDRVMLVLSGPVIVDHEDADDHDFKGGEERVETAVEVVVGEGASRFEGVGGGEDGEDDALEELKEDDGLEGGEFADHFAVCCLEGLLVSEEHAEDGHEGQGCADAVDD